MAVALRAATTFTGTQVGAATGIAPAWPTGTVTGDVVYAIVNNTGGTVTVPSGWTQAASWGGTKIHRYAYTNGDVAPTWTHSAGSDQWEILYVTATGVDLTTPEDSTPGTGDRYPTTTLAMPNVTVAATSGALVLYVAGGAGATSTTSGPGLTTVFDNAHLHLLTSSPNAGTITGPTVTFSASQGSTAFRVIALAVRPANAVIVQPGPTVAAGAPAPQPGGKLIKDAGGNWVPEVKPNPLTRPATAYMRTPNVMSRCKSYPGAVTTPQLNSRRQHVALFDAVDPVFIFGNMQGIESLSNLGDLTVSAVVEVPNGNGSTQSTSQGWRLRFAGKTTVTIPPGGYIKADPIPLRLYRGQPYFVRTYATVVNGTQIPILQIIPESTRFEFSDSTTASDLTAVSNTLANATPLGVYGVCAVEATPLGRTLLPMVVGLGDSIMEGVSRTDLFGWFDQVMELARIPHLKLSMSGEQNVQFIGQPGGTLDSLGRIYRGRFLSGATDIVSNSSINDINTGATFAQMQTRVLNAAKVAGYYGARFHQATITPYTTSTDSWATLANQTPANAGQETVRTQTNAWLRDGAPVNKTTLAAVATGDASGTTIRAGAYGHPITGIIDLAAAVEVTNGTALVWQVNAATPDGLHPGNSGHNMMAVAFAAYTATHFAPPANT